MREILKDYYIIIEIRVFEQMPVINNKYYDLIKLVLISAIQTLNVVYV